MNVVKNLENVISTTREKQIVEKTRHERETVDLERIKSDFEKCQREK